MASHHPVKFSDHVQSDSGNMMLFKIEEQNSTLSRFNLSLLFISRAHGMPWSHTYDFRTNTQFASVSNEGLTDVGHR